MDESTESRNCPRCGAISAAAECPSCGHELGGVGLRLVPAAEAKKGAAPSAVKLLREYKGPTAQDLLSASPEVVDLLPGRVLSVEVAVREDDLATANTRLDHALGMVLRGPGHNRQRNAKVWLILVLWMWFCTLAVLLLWVIT